MNSIISLVSILNTSETPETKAIIGNTISALLKNTSLSEIIQLFNTIPDNMFRNMVLITLFNMNQNYLALLKNEDVNKCINEDFISYLTRNSHKLLCALFKYEIHPKLIENIIFPFVITNISTIDKLVINELIILIRRLIYKSTTVYLITEEKLINVIKLLAPLKTENVKLYLHKNILRLIKYDKLLLLETLLTIDKSIVRHEASIVIIKYFTNNIKNYTLQKMEYNENQLVKYLKLLFKLNVEKSKILEYCRIMKCSNSLINKLTGNIPVITLPSTITPSSTISTTITPPLFRKLPEYFNNPMFDICDKEKLLNSNIQWENYYPNSHYELGKACTEFCKNNCSVHSYSYGNNIKSRKFICENINCTRLCRVHMLKPNETETNKKQRT